ncbi:hypothetical protein [Clostridium akagii]|uniref:hypothetical protein n=1 Tax=Clostridium akagii TaxID=91623 RepID=UPI000478A08C|nr:hypothetical protein [Clostridium akagii]
MEYNIGKYKRKIVKGQYYFYYREDKERSFVIFSENELIRRVLEDFINSYCSLEVATQSKKRKFLKKFQESLKDEIISEENWFSKELFYKQYNFYNGLGMKTELITFYRFITVGIYGERYKSDFTKIFIASINSKNFHEYYKSGFTFVYHNLFEEPPKENKICIIPSESVLINANSKNTGWRGIDLTICNERYREDLRNFIWSNWSSSCSFNHYPRLVDFLNLSNVEQCSDKVIQINKLDKEFGEEFLWNYKIMIKNEVENKSTIKNIFKIIRKYLMYYKEKYRVDEADFDIFSLAKLDNYDGGNVMTEKDMNLIYKAFKKNEIAQPSLRIYSLVFEFFLTTKYRIGEILNFRRDCFEKPDEKLDDKTYDISYIGKTTDQCIVTEKISSKSAHILSEATKLTKNIVNNGGLCDNFIFVESYHATNIKFCKRINFTYEFHKILDELSNVLDKTNYIVNNIRNTFIDNVYKEGTKYGLSINRMALIAGNSYKVANKHYRDRNDLLNYLEATNGVCIADVDVMGTILEKDDYKIINKVKGGLGKCVSSRCLFEIGECLRCNDFVTFTNREKNFENEILKIQNSIENTENTDEIEELAANKKLMLRYLYEIKKVIDQESEKV